MRPEAFFSLGCPFGKSNFDLPSLLCIRDGSRITSTTPGLAKLRLPSVLGDIYPASPARVNI